ncbi:MAG: hypothetical protein ACLGHN_14475 [Bacteriovoracia bacterium]
MKYLLTLFICLSAFADASREVFIRGKIGNEFNEKKVKVIDSEGQVYFLSRKLFPKDLKIKQGQSFAIEVHEKELNKIKILKK